MRYHRQKRYKENVPTKNGVARSEQFASPAMDIGAEELAISEKGKIDQHKVKASQHQAMQRGNELGRIKLFALNSKVPRPAQQPLMQAKVNGTPSGHTRRWGVRLDSTGTGTRNEGEEDNSPERAEAGAAPPMAREGGMGGRAGGVARTTKASVRRELEKDAKEWEYERGKEVATAGEHVFDIDQQGIQARANPCERTLEQNPRADIAQPQYATEPTKDGKARTPYANERRVGRWRREHQPTANPEEERGGRAVRKETALEPGKPEQERQQDAGPEGGGGAPRVVKRTGVIVGAKSAGWRGLVQRAALKKGFNVAGEYHDEAAKDRWWEKRATEARTGGQYWTEDTFTWNHPGWFSDPKSKLAANWKPQNVKWTNMVGGKKVKQPVMRWNRRFGDPILLKIQYIFARLKYASARYEISQIGKYGMTVEAEMHGSKRGTDIGWAKLPRAKRTIKAMAWALKSILIDWAGLIATIEDAAAHQDWLAEELYAKQFFSKALLSIKDKLYTRLRAMENMAEGFWGKGWRDKAEPQYEYAKAEENRKKMAGLVESNIEWLVKVFKENKLSNDKLHGRKEFKDTELAKDKTGMVSLSAKNWQKIATEDASKARSRAMHDMAKMASTERRGVWKVGDAHVTHLKKFRAAEEKQNAAASYNLLTAAEFGDEVDKYRTELAKKNPDQFATTEKAKQVDSFAHGDKKRHQDLEEEEEKESWKGPDDVTKEKRVKLFKRWAKTDMFKGGGPVSKHTHDYRGVWFETYKKKDK